MENLTIFGSNLYITSLNLCMSDSFVIKEEMEGKYSCVIQFVNCLSTLREESDGPVWFVSILSLSLSLKGPNCVSPPILRTGSVAMSFEIKRSRSRSNDWRQLLNGGTRAGEKEM